MAGRGQYVRIVQIIVNYPQPLFFISLALLQNLRNEEQVAIIQASTVLSLAEKVIHQTNIQIISMSDFTPKEQGRVEGWSLCT